MMNASKMWATDQMNLHEAIKIAALQAISDELDALSQKWAAEAIAAAALGNWGRAAGLSAAAVAASGASALISAEAQKQLDKIEQRKQEEADSAASSNDFASGAGPSTSFAGYSTRGIQNLYIQPSVTISGEFIAIGEGSIEAASASIGQIAVDVVKDAIETGEIRFEGV
jgi:hypothetical protein